jgi:hypothetical protein
MINPLLYFLIIFMVSKPEIIGEQILKRVLSRNKDYGGILVEITGAQGTSKTSTLLSFMKTTIREHPNEKIFFREQMDAPLQIFKLGQGQYKFFIKRDSNIVFRNRDKHLQIIDMNPGEFSTYKELYDKAIPGKVNVVFFDSNAEWMSFITYLRSAGEWVNIFVDEMADICPAVNRGAMFKQILDFSGVMGAVRRCMMNVFYNTQTAQDIDWKVRKKVMLKILLPGAIADKDTRVTQKAIDNLIRDPVHGNEAYLDAGGEFGKVRFTDIFKPISGYHIEAHQQWISQRNEVPEENGMEEFNGLRKTVTTT